MSCAPTAVETMFAPLCNLVSTDLAPPHPQAPPMTGTRAPPVVSLADRLRSLQANKAARRTGGGATAVTAATAMAVPAALPAQGPLDLGGDDDDGDADDGDDDDDEATIPDSFRGALDPLHGDDGGAYGGDVFGSLGRASLGRMDGAEPSSGAMEFDLENSREAVRPPSLSALGMSLSSPGNGSTLGRTDLRRHAAVAATVTTSPPVTSSPVVTSPGPAQWVAATTDATREAAILASAVHTEYEEVSSGSSYDSDPDYMEAKRLRRARERRGECAVGGDGDGEGADEPDATGAVGSDAAAGAWYVQDGTCMVRPSGEPAPRDGEEAVKIAAFDMDSTLINTPWKHMFGRSPDGMRDCLSWVAVVSCSLLLCCCGFLL